MREHAGYTPAAQIPEDYQWSSWKYIREKMDTAGFERDADSPANEVLTSLHSASQQQGGLKKEDLEGLLRLMSRTFILPVQ